MVHCVLWTVRQVYFVHVAGTACFWRNNCSVPELLSHSGGVSQPQSQWSHGRILVSGSVTVKILLRTVILAVFTFCMNVLHKALFRFNVVRCVVPWLTLRYPRLKYGVCAIVSSFSPSSLRRFIYQFCFREPSLRQLYGQRECLSWSK